MQQAMTRTILVTDDIADVPLLLRGLLADRPYRLVYEARKDRAIAKLGKIRPDLVTTDLTPAPVDGFAVIQGVKNYDRNIPVIVISGTLNQRKRWVAHRLGATVCLAKPIRPARLRDLLDELLYCVSS